MLEKESGLLIRQEDVQKDVDVILWSLKLYQTRRYFHQLFWEKETEAAEQADFIEGYPRLETVAEHSWHVADIVILLGGHFPNLDLYRCIRMAILHDKMEIITGDKNPLGWDGTGHSTHAFCTTMRLRKDSEEKAAVSQYISALRESAKLQQCTDLEEIIEGRTNESRFIKAVDKLQALAYVLLKKQGNFQDQHLRFTLKYSEKAADYFPPLKAHYYELRRRLVSQVAEHRKLTDQELLSLI